MLLLLTWHDSSIRAMESIYDSVTPTSLPQHDSSTHGKDSVYESVTPRCMPHGMLTSPTDEPVITYTQLSDVQEVDIEDRVLPTIHSQFSDISLSSGDVAAETQVEVLVSEEANVGRTEVPVFEKVDGGRTEEHVVEQEAVEAHSDEQVNCDVEGIDNAYETLYHVESSEDTCTDDDDFLVDEKNEIVESDVDVHLVLARMFL
ncbi:hypothetical protein Tco_0921711 [Tanacetum coccineum]